MERIKQRTLGHVRCKGLVISLIALSVTLFLVGALKYWGVWDIALAVRLILSNIVLRAYFILYIAILCKREKAHIYLAIMYLAELLLSGIYLLQYAERFSRVVDGSFVLSSGTGGSILNHVVFMVLLLLAAVLLLRKKANRPVLVAPFAFQLVLTLLAQYNSFVFYEQLPAEIGRELMMDALLDSGISIAWFLALIIYFCANILPWKKNKEALPAQVQAVSAEMELKQLEERYQNGLITPEEYSKRRAEIINKL